MFYGVFVLLDLRLSLCIIFRAVTNKAEINKNQPTAHPC